MTRHLADKRGPSEGGRLVNFLRISRGAGEGAPGDGVWRALWKAPRRAPAEGRRVVEYLRIARGRSV
ncbi:MAG: hypothetical protein ACK4GO_18530 [Gemmobacter sp.]